MPHTKRFWSLSVAAFVLLTCQAVAAVNTTPQAKSEIKSDVEIGSLVTQLTGESWSMVSNARLALESRQGHAIPHLMALLDRDEYVKLQGTFDLIYPGAKKYYGHGEILRYDIDWLTVRAGWVLEKITFQDFGFSEDIREDDLFEARLNGRVDGPLNEAIPINNDAEARQRQRARAVERCKRWWSSQNGKFDRFTALLDALKSGKPSSALNALHWLRFEKTHIDGFNKKSYLRQVLPIVRMLAKSSDRQVSTQAGYLVHDYEVNEWWWLTQKNQHPDGIGK